MLLAPITLLCAVPAAEAAPIEIKLDRCALRWDETNGLAVLYDGRTVLEGTRGLFVAHPAGWTWSYDAWQQGSVQATHTRDGDRQVLRIEGTSEKITWTETVTAGPGDRFTVEYAYRQNAWDDMKLQLCLFLPATEWLVGAQWRAKGAAGETTGEIPAAFDGKTNPFGGATSAEFGTLFGALRVQATRGITLFDYAHRANFWLGLDEAFPRDEEQRWSAEFAFEPRPFVVGGVRIEEVRAPERAAEGAMQVQLRLAREANGPREVTARLVLASAEPATAEETVTLAAAAAPVALRLPVAEPGQIPFRLELVAAGQTLYTSPQMVVVVPRWLSILPGRTPYTAEATGEVLVTVDAEAGDGLRLVLEGSNGELFAGPVEAGRRTAVPVELAGLPMGQSEITARLERGGQAVAGARCTMLRAAPREHVVVVDHRGRGLIVDGLPFVPRSFYCSWGDVPVDEEAVTGFNMVAPYLTGEIAERRRMRDDLRKLLDRCAQVGLYVHLDIRSAATMKNSDEKWAWVQEEVEAFRDHPALLCWYLADEPELGSATPEECAEAYRRIKAWDPYHPITMVFCQSAAAARYAEGMDVVMTDPYPIPNGPVTSVRDFCRQIRGDIADAQPLWVVPQAFGGGEGWRREPSRQEERVMTYLALIHGAKGLQPFIRRPPIGNPTSPDLWSECRRLALEIGQLTPALASGEEAPEVRCSAGEVDVAAFQERGAVTVLAANVENRPVPIELTLAAALDGQAEVLFENRTVPVSGGKWSDVIEALGTRAYRLQVGPPPEDRATIDPANLIVNPSFEEAHNVGTPDGSYLGAGADRSASWFVDPRLSVHGRQSLLLTTPAEGKGVSVQPFPIGLTAGQRYRLSVWARGEREGMQFSLSLDAVSAEQGTHALTTEWQEYAVEFTATQDPSRYTALQLISAGRAWFDALQVVPVE